jgi:hypothetical protein
MAKNELTMDKLVDIIGKRLSGGAPISPEEIVRDYQVSKDYSERIAKMLDTPVTKIAGHDIPPFTEHYFIKTTWADHLKAVVADQPLGERPAPSEEISRESIRGGYGKLLF